MNIPDTYLAPLSIALGTAAVVLSFCPVEIQILGVVAGIAGIVMSRRAKRLDYRRDMPATIGLVLSIAGMCLCLLAGVLALIAQILSLFVG